MDNEKDGRIEIVVPENSMKEAAESLHDGDILGVLPLRNRVLFTSVLIPITVTRPKSLKLVMEAFESDKLLAVFCQKDQNVSEPNEADLYRLGVAAKVLRIIPVGEDSFFVILQGVERIYLDEITQTDPYLEARVNLRPEDLQSVNSAEFTTLASSIKTTTLKLFQNMENIPQDALMGIKTLTYPPMVVNYIAANFPMSLEERQSLLGINDLKDRAISLITILNKEENNLSVKQEIQKKTEEEVNKNQREYYLHQQMHAIQKELGETSEKDVSRLRERAQKKHWNSDVAEVFDNELQKLERMGIHSAEYPSQLNYLETLLALPWNEFTEDNLDIHNAQKVLDKDHFGMEDVKERILEHLAVLRQVHAAQEKSKKNADSMPLRPSGSRQNQPWTQYSQGPRQKICPHQSRRTPR